MRLDGGRHEHGDRHNVKRTDRALSGSGRMLLIQDQFGWPHLAEVIGFRGANVLSMPVETTEGIRVGDAVLALEVRPEIEVPLLELPPSPTASERAAACLQPRIRAQIWPLPGQPPAVRPLLRRPR
jgi:hypothetical protein